MASNKDTLLLGGNDPLTDDVRAELAHRRDEFWRQVGATALGVFIGLTLHSVAIYLLLREWVERSV